MELKLAPVILLVPLDCQQSFLVNYKYGVTCSTFGSCLCHETTVGLHFTPLLRITRFDAPLARPHQRSPFSPSFRGKIQHVEREITNPIQNREKKLSMPTSSIQICLAIDVIANSEHPIPHPMADCVAVSNLRNVFLPESWVLTNL